MTRKYSFLYMSIGLWLLICSLGGATEAIGACGQEQAVAKIVSVQGTVTVNRASARLNSLVCPADIVRVGRLSRAAIQLFAKETISRLDQLAIKSLVVADA